MAKNRDHLRIDHLLEDLGRRSVRGGAVAVSGHALRLVAQIGAVAVLARVLPREHFGLMAMVMTCTGVLLIVRDFGLGQVTVQHDEISDAEVSTLFWIGMAMSALASLLVLGMAPLVAMFFGRPELLGITAAMASVFVIGGLGLQHQALLQRQMRFGRIALVDLTAFVIGQASGVAAALGGAGYWSLVTIHITTALALVVGHWIACGWRPGRPAPLERVRPWLKFGSNLTGANFFNYLSRNADDLLIGRFFGAGSLALYSKAYQLLMLPIRQIIQPLSGVAIPALSRLGEHPERYRDTYTRIVEKACLVTIPCAAFMFLCSDWIILTILGPQWSDASELLAILSIAVLFQPLSNSTGWLFITQARGVDMRRWSMVGAGLSIAAFAAGIPWGVRGMALSYALSGLLIRAPLLYWWVGREGPVRTRDIWRCAIAGGGAGAGVLVAVHLARGMLELLPAPLALLVSIPVAVVGGLVGVASSRAGRAAFVDSLYIFRVLLRTRGSGN